MLNKLMAVCGIALLITACKQAPSDTWPIEKAQRWYAAKGWLRGCNFIPSTAVNQLEMWQAATFDSTTIDRELGYAEGIGLNSMRVYLHHVPWVEDAPGFKQRMATYLAIATRHHLSTAFVFFDDCWNNVYAGGPQPPPIPGVHNSRWVQDPGIAIFDHPMLKDTLERYVKDILQTFGKDPRVLFWDLYNEPGSFGAGNRSMSLLEDVFRWSRAVKPSQPLTVGIWNPDLKELSEYEEAHSDIITYHNYLPPDMHQQDIQQLRPFNRPLLCTEYMARTLGSRFDNIMPLLKQENIGAYSWGLVAGKTNTMYAQGMPVQDGSEPALWYHDIFRKDGTPYNVAEIKLIRALTE